MNRKFLLFLQECWTFQEEPLVSVFSLPDNLHLASLYNESNGGPLIFQTGKLKSRKFCKFQVLLDFELGFELNGTSGILKPDWEDRHIENVVIAL